MKILLLNLTRFGDLLQSQAAINSLNGLAPGFSAPGAANGLATLSGPHEVALACLENFAETADLLSGLKAVFPFSGSAVLKPLAPGSGAGWTEALAALYAWRASVEAFGPDVICNLTPSLSARLLARHCAGQGPVYGFGVDNFGFRQDNSPWAVFLQAASTARGVSPFNIVDLFRAVAGNSRPASCPCAFSAYGGKAADSALRRPAEAEIAGLRLRLEGELGAEERFALKGFVALQTGASEERRRWPLEHFAEVGDALWRDFRLMPLLLGSLGEKALGERYAALAEGPHISLIGRTSQPELAAALCLSSLLISNDTGTMHLAAGLEVPVLAIFLATAQPWDTGPYLAGSCSLEADLPCHPCPFGQACPHDLRCRTAVSPALVGKLAAAFLREGSFAAASVKNEGARVWQAEYDAYGFMDLKSLSGHEREERGLWMHAQRVFLRHFLDLEAGLDFVPPGLPLLSGPLPGVEKLRSSLGTVRALNGLLAEQGELLLRNPLPRLREKFLQGWQKTALAWETGPELRAISLLWRENTQSRSGSLEETLLCLRNYNTLLDWLLRELR